MPTRGRLRLRAHNRPTSKKKNPNLPELYSVGYFLSENTFIRVIKERHLDYSNKGTVRIYMSDLLLHESGINGDIVEREEESKLLEDARQSGGSKDNRTESIAIVRALDKFKIRLLCPLVMPFLFIVCQYPCKRRRKKQF